MLARHASSGFRLSPASGHSGACSAAAAAVGLRLQHHSDRRGARQGRMERGAQPVSAPRRPDPQPGRDGEGLRRARKGRAGRRGRGARQGDAGDAAAGRADRSRSLQGVPGRSVRPDQRTVEAAGRRGELSRPQGQPEFPGLQAQLEGTENRIAVARRDYIEAVGSYNTTLKTFPSIIWATLWFTDNEPFQNFTVAKTRSSRRRWISTRAGEGGCCP